MIYCPVLQEKVGFCHGVEIKSIEEKEKKDERNNPMTPHVLV